MESHIRIYNTEIATRSSKKMVGDQGESLDKGRIVKKRDVVEGSSGPKV